ncbi:TPA: hypothetical protein EYP66_11445 [Candidatus Poribacteria bacterium]|nr:hypothetical protein [Candidatus Poribacteria bacterium]
MAISCLTKRCLMYIHLTFFIMRKMSIIKQLEGKIQAINNLSALRQLVVDAAKVEKFSDFIDVLNEVEM